MNKSSSRSAARLSGDFPPPPFAGFAPAAFAFFRGLAENQTKAWFDANREIYEMQVRAPLSSLVVEVAVKLSAKGLPLAGDPKRAIFRLNRDVRFSADKSPYKTNAGAAMTRDGGKMSPGVLYIHVSAKDCFTAAGFYQPETPELQAMREAIVRDFADWKKITKALPLSREDALINPPKGFTPETPDMAEALKLKSWIVRRPLAMATMRGPGLVDEIVDFALAAAPLLQFGWAALEKRKLP
jgi:uncharacterized protein (TIGR02453 family)